MNILLQQHDIAHYNKQTYKLNVKIQLLVIKIAKNVCLGSIHILNISLRKGLNKYSLQERYSEIFKVIFSNKIKYLFYCS